MSSRIELIWAKCIYTFPYCNLSHFWNNNKDEILQIKSEIVSPSINRFEEQSCHELLESIHNAALSCSHCSLVAYWTKW